MSKYTRFSKTTVAILTALLIISIAAPLLSFAAAAGGATVSISPTSGPNGTAIKVAGTNFAQTVQNDHGSNAITVTIDGKSGYAITDTGSGVTFTSANALQTTATGVLSGYFVITGLSAGTHQIQISDGSTVPSLVTFNVIEPTVTLSASGPVGTSVLVSGAGFPLSTALTGGPAIVNTIAQAKFAGQSLTLSPTTPATATASELSSTAITNGAYTGTVSLQKTVTATSGTAFTLIDQFGNIATTIFNLNTPTVTLSTTSGPLDTLVTASVSGFGPGATFGANSIQFCSSTTLFSPIAIGTADPTVTEQGTATFQFYVSGSTADLVTGAHTVTVTDSLGNTASTTFTITASATVTLGLTGANSDTPYAPAGRSNVVAFLSVNGFSPNAAITVTGSSNVPAGWTTLGGAFANLKTDANGQITTEVESLPGTAPAQTGQYALYVSDGTSQVQVPITIAGTDYIYTERYSTTNINSGAPGSVVIVSVYGVPAGQITFNNQNTGVSAAVPNAWPQSCYNSYTYITVPSVSVGTYSIGSTVVGFNKPQFTVVAPSISITPNAAAIGTKITVVGSSFSDVPSTLLSFTVDGLTIPAANVQASYYGGSFVATIVVPTLVGNPHTIIATDSAANSASASFTANAASIAVTPVSGKLTNFMGSTTTFGITGTGFTAGESLVVYFDGAPVSTSALARAGLTVANPSGNILLNKGFKLPSTTPGVTAGSHVITVVGSSSGASATATFTVQPKVELSATAVRPGTAIQISGYGFAATTTQALSINGTAATWYNVGVNPATAITNQVPTTTAAGNLNGAPAVTIGTFIPATTASGTLNITVTDAAGNTASATLTVLADPAITIGTSSIVAGAQAGVPTASSPAINGTGFTPRTATTGIISAQLYSGNTPIANSVNLLTAVGAGSSIVVDGSGAFSVDSSNVQYETFVIPSTVPAGTYTLVFKIGTTGSTPIETANTTITVLSAPIVTINPATAASGSNVSISITGLSVVSSAALTVNGAPLYMTLGSTAYAPSTNIANEGPQPTISTSGENAYTLNSWFIVPNTLIGGTYVLTISDVAASLNAITQLTITPTVAVTPRIHLI